MPTDYSVETYPLTSSGQLAEVTMQSTMFSWASVVLGLIGVLVMVLYLVLWIYMIVDVIRRDDLKESKLLWIVLFLFIAPVGMVAYGFVEGKKKLGWLSLAPIIVFPLLLSLYAIAGFVIKNG